MRRTRDYAEFELIDDDIGELLKTCLAELGDAAEIANAEEHLESATHQSEDAEGIKRDQKRTEMWNPSKEELARWCTLLYSQWLLGKFEDDMGLDLESEKNAAVRKYLDVRTPQIFAYIESGCPGYGKS